MDMPRDDEGAQLPRKDAHKEPHEEHEARQGQETEEGRSRPMTIEEAARKGGNTTKERYGPDFYSRIGRKGGQRVARERGPEFYSEIGRKGGEARVAQSRRLEQEGSGEGESEQ